MKKIKTLQFGDIEIEDEHIIHFPEGILGFEDLKNYVLISEEETVPFKWLLSLESPDIGFPLLSPWLLELDYNPGNDFDYNIHAIFVIITLEDELGRMTANLKAPVVVDVNQKTGEQIILTTDKYSTNHLISNNKTATGATE
jgi:flagellar assembly factor FliW